MKGPIIFNDISAWQTISPPFRAMRENGIVLTVIKYSMGFGLDRMAEKHTEAARQAGMPYGGYHWLDPTAAPHRQGELFLRQIDKLRPCCIVFDDEQWWADWAKWQEWNDRKISLEAVPKCSPERIEACLRGTVEWVNARTDLPWGLYSGWWFIQTYYKLRPSVIEFYRKAPLRIWAEYDDAKLGIRRITWEGLRALALSSKLDTVPPEFRDDAQQFTSRVIIPGYATRLDFSVWHGTLEAWQNWLQLSPPTFDSLTDKEKWEIVKRDLIERGRLGSDGTIL